MTVDDVLAELESLGSEQTRTILMRHGAREPFYGVKVQDLQTIRKRVKVDHDLALALYDTGVSDAMYLAGMIADPDAMTKKTLKGWATKAYWYMLSETTVPGVAADGLHGWSLGMEWIERRKESLAACGWVTLSNVLSVRPDEELDEPVLKDLLGRVGESIHDQPNRVRYCMNGYVIAVGAYVPSLLREAKRVAKSIGTVEVDMGGTSCKVPFAPDYIRKIEEKGRVGKKRKMARC